MRRVYHRLSPWIKHESQTRQPHHTYILHATLAIPYCIRIKKTQYHPAPGRMYWRFFYLSHRQLGLVKVLRRTWPCVVTTSGKPYFWQAPHLRNHLYMVLNKSWYITNYTSFISFKTHSNVCLIWSSVCCLVLLLRFHLHYTHGFIAFILQE